MVYTLCDQTRLRFACGMLTCEREGVEDEGLKAVKQLVNKRVRQEQYTLSLAGSPNVHF